jgi:hypothetical protein
MQLIFPIVELRRILIHFSEMPAASRDPLSDEKASWGIGREAATNRHMHQEMFT